MRCNKYFTLILLQFVIYVCVWTSWAHIYEYSVLLCKIGCDKFQIEEEENKLRADIEEAEKQYPEVISEMKDLETKSKQFKELEEQIVLFLLAIFFQASS